MPDPLRITSPGLYPDMTAADYFADPCPEPSLTQTVAKILIGRSPRHAWHAHPRLNPDWQSDEYKYDKARAIGNGVHRMMLGRGKDITNVRIPRRVKVKNKWTVPDPADLVDADDMTTEAAQHERDRIAASGGVPILLKHADTVSRITGAAREQIDSAGCFEAFRRGNAEVVMVAQDGDIWLRAMADWVVSEALLYDLKTGETSAAPQDIPRRMTADGWDVQAAMQERILDLLYPATRGRRRFLFIAIEDQEPYALTVNELPATVMEIGHRKLAYAIDLWRECMQRGEWPAYAPRIYRPEYPPYAESQWLNREIGEAGQARLPGRSWGRNAPFDPNVINAG